VFLGIENGSGSFLSKLIDPPSRDAIDSAIFSLDNIGAIVTTCNRERKNVALTPLGLHLAGIPAPPSIGKLLVMGALLGCRSAALAIAAGLSTGKNPFLKIDNRKQRNTDNKDFIQNELVLQERKKLFNIVGNSDHAMLAAIFMEWNSLAGGNGLKRKYLNSLGLSAPTMYDMKQLVQQYDSALCNAGFDYTKDSDQNSKSWRIIRSCIVSALAPSQIVRVQRPATKYAETAEGAVEKDAAAKELKFYIRSDSQDANSVVKYYHGISEEQVFIHPSSANFSIGTYACPWLVYYHLVRTSKPFMRDVTECSSYDLLLFGGNIEVLASNNLIVIDNYVRLSANARIGALVGGLRKKIDEILSKKISDPQYDVADSVEMRIIVKLLRTDGLG
jgi:ATP-dependent RNA helicase DHX57